LTKDSFFNISLEAMGFKISKNKDKSPYLVSALSSILFLEPIQAQVRAFFFYPRKERRKNG